tara:strand:+ start:336 stop:1139 length:804 start_codon:yes stop_codon:yes gene_type:complete
MLQNLLINYAIGRALGGKKGGKTAAIASLVNPLLSQGLGNDNILSNIFGAKNNNNMLSNIFGVQNAETPPNIKTANNIITENFDDARELAIAKSGGMKFPTDGSEASVNPVTSFKQNPKTIGIAKFLIDLGIMPEDSKFANLLNSRVGEALALGLGAQLTDSLFSKGKKDRLPSKPFGGVEGYTDLGIRRAAHGGYINQQYFPRRDGGIMPSEGSGKKDDVPAMLTAGEFVFTKDAVNGLGNGNQRLGIERAYNMMDKLENKANKYG